MNTRVQRILLAAILPSAGPLAVLAVVEAMIRTETVITGWLEDEAVLTMPAAVVCAALASPLALPIARQYTVAQRIWSALAGLGLGVVAGELAHWVSHSTGPGVARILMWASMVAATFVMLGKPADAGDAKQA